MSQSLPLIDIAARFPTLDIDLKYATADNLTGRPIYGEARCLLHPDAAAALELSLIHISEPTRRHHVSRMPSSA